MASLSSQTVIVSYSASPGFLSSSSWPQIQQALCAQFPLRNIHWKSATRTSLRTIQQLDVSLANLDTIRDEHASQIPGNLLEKPLLNIYLACCEDNDVDTYRTNIKRHAKEWHASVSTRKNQEWLIIQVVKQDAKTPGGAFFQLKGSVLDKLRSDFNTDKRERCVQLTWSSAQDSPIVWGEIMNKWKDGLLSAFESALTQREDEVKRSESQRQMPGWNFCTFFILKESLASSFYSMNLLSEALLQYDELEASFFQVLKEKNLSWFGTLITPTPRDDSGALLSISRKPYRDLILANTISVFDFRIYLLARQCEILARMNRLPDVSRRCVAFLGAFGRRLREVQDTLPKFFIESWTYTSSLSVVDQCTTWEADLSPDKSQINAIFAGKGELLELARTQLDILGIESTHLPPTPPFCHAVPSSDFPNSSSSSGEISNKDLLQALKDPEAFYELYIVTTNRAIDLYRKAGRRKFALKLHGSLASLDIHRGRFDAALTTYTSLPGHYAHKWSSLEGLMLSLALDNHEALQRPKGGEWIHLMLSFLATYMDHGTELLLSKEDALAYLRELISAMWDAATKLEQNLVHTDHPAISVKAASDARLQPGRDGLLLDVVILNRLPCDIPIQDVRVILAGADNVRLQFTASCDVLRSGRNELTLSCLASSPGSYLLDSSEILMSKIIFKWQSRKDGTKNKSKAKLHLVRVPKDYQALSVQIRQPKLVALGKRSSVLVVIKTGRNDVDTMSLNITSPSITFHLEETELDGVSEVELTKTDKEVTLKSVPNNSEVTLRVTHTDVVGPTMKITVHVQYLTKAESTVTRDISVTQTVLVTLPISVNVEDFFRGTRLFSRFTVSTTTHQHVRVASTSLQCEEGDSLKIVSCNAKGRGIMSVTPAQPAHFLFYIDSTGPVRQPLTLRVRYRMLREEVHSLIEEAVDSLDSSYQRDVLVELVVQALESDATWIDQYGLTGEVILPERSLDGLENKESLERLKQMLASTDKDISACGIWREMLIPVDVPSMNIVASVHMNVPTKTPVYKFYAGQPISATLSIHTSFRWDASDNKDRVYQMEYDVEEIVRDWLVSGRKRGDFIAVDDGTFTVPLTLIALHHGELAMPKVLVSALPSGGPMTMGSLSIPSTETYQNHGAEKILVLPRGGRTTFVTEMG